LHNILKIKRVLDLMLFEGGYKNAKDKNK
jgi:hypothetical protein